MIFWGANARRAAARCLSASSPSGLTGGSPRGGSLLERGARHVGPRDRCRPIPLLLTPWPAMRRRIGPQAVNTEDVLYLFTLLQLYLPQLRLTGVN